MKKLLLAGVVGLSLSAAAAVGVNQSNDSKKSENADCQYGRCARIKSDGYQCGNCAQKGSYYCWNHSR